MDYISMLFGGQQSQADVDAHNAYIADQRRTEAARLASIAQGKAQQERTLRCSRCYGTGFVSQFRHVQGGRCFACN